MRCRLATLPRTATLSAAMVLCTWSLAGAQTPVANSPADSAGERSIFARSFSPAPLDSAPRVAMAPGAAKRLWKGGIIGGSIGLALGFAAQTGACENECLMGDDPWAGIAVFTGIGAGIGLAIAAGMNHSQRAAVTHRTTTVAVAPVLSKTHKGLAFSMTWR